MSEVTLIIAGRKHIVACADGEEAHIAELGQMIDRKFAQLGNPTGPDSQKMLFAALLLADELHEAREAASNEEKSRAKLTEERDLLAERVEQFLAAPPMENTPAFHGSDAELAPALERFAELLENCADKLETKAPRD